MLLYLIFVFQHKASEYEFIDFTLPSQTQTQTQTQQSQSSQLDAVGNSQVCVKCFLYIYVRLISAFLSQSSRSPGFQEKQ